MHKKCCSFSCVIKKISGLSNTNEWFVAGAETRSRRDKSTSPLESILQASTRDVGCSITEDNQSTSQLVTSRFVELPQPVELNQTELIAALETNKG